MCCGTVGVGRVCAAAHNVGLRVQLCSDLRETAYARTVADTVWRASASRWQATAHESASDGASGPRRRHATRPRRWWCGHRPDRTVWSRRVGLRTRRDGPREHGPSQTAGSRATADAARPSVLGGGAVAHRIRRAGDGARVFTRLDPQACDLSKSLGPPQVGHIFGFDLLGCDHFTRTVYGARTSLVIAVIVVAIAVVLGALAGMAGGPIDVVISRATDVVFGVPVVLGWWSSRCRTSAGSRRWRWCLRHCRGPRCCA